MLYFYKAVATLSKDFLHNGLYHREFFLLRPMTMHNKKLNSQADLKVSGDRASIFMPFSDNIFTIPIKFALLWLLPTG